MRTLQATDRQETFGFKSKASVQGHSFPAICYITCDHFVSLYILSRAIVVAFSYPHRWPNRSHLFSSRRFAQVNAKMHTADRSRAARGFNPQEGMVKAVLQQIHGASLTGPPHKFKFPSLVIQTALNPCLIFFIPSLYA